MDRRAEALAELQEMGVPAHLGELHDYDAAKRAYIVDRGCTSKVRHETEGAALAAIMCLKRRTGMRQWHDAYQCPHCGGWHIAKGVRPPGRGKR